MNSQLLGCMLEKIKACSQKLFDLRDQGVNNKDLEFIMLPLNENFTIIHLDQMRILIWLLESVLISGGPNGQETIFRDKYFAIEVLRLAS